MVKALSYRLEQCFGPFTMSLVKGSMKRDFLHIYLTTFLRVRKFKNTSALRVISFLKNFKIESKFKKSKKNWENIFRFWVNCIRKCCNKLALLRKRYFSSAVNRLTNSPKILHITKRKFFQLNCGHRDQ